MGGPKADLLLEGRTLLHRVADRLLGVCRESVVVVASGQRVETDIRVIEDRIADCGPIGGLVTAFERLTAPWIVAVSCDTPFLSRQLVRRMFVLTASADIIAPERNGRLQPLMAIYGRAAAEVASRRLANGQLRLTELLHDDALRVHTVTESEWTEWGVTDQSFLNINTPEEFDEARRILEDPEFAKRLLEERP